MTAPSSSTDRPTLPSLRSLNLPMPSPKPFLPTILKLYPNFNRHATTTSPNTNSWHHRQRQASISSTCTSGSSTSSVSPPPSASTGSTSLSPSPPPPPPRRYVRMILANSFEEADAVLVFTVPGIPAAANLAPTVPCSPNALDCVKPGSPLILVSSSLARFHASGRRVARGARAHPYRLDRPSGSRRSSVASS
ncbi:hypothetical protein OF83DRAFT_1167177 [Amylostereum chailletii]|nr:hypothetical protein OF83DRAFT_1167177 [Amylostereum chailletii]